MMSASVNFPSASGADVRPFMRRTGQPEKNSSLVLRLATTIACRSGSGRALGRARVLPAHTGRHVISAFDGRWRARLKANPYALDHSLGGSIEALKTHVFVSAGYPSTGSRRLFVSDQFFVGEMRDV